jgi:hypothetical protein
MLDYCYCAMQNHFLVIIITRINLDPSSTDLKTIFGMITLQCCFVYQGQDDEGEGHGDSPDGGPTLTPHQDHPKLQANSYRGKGPPTELDDGDDERLFAMQWACRHDDSKYLRRQLYPGPLNIFRSENKRVIKVCTLYCVFFFVVIQFLIQSGFCG